MLKSIWRKFSFVRQNYRTEYIIVVVFIILNDICYVIPPRLAGKIADLVAAGGLSFQAFMWYIGAMVLTAILTYATGYVCNYYLWKAFDVTCHSLHQAFARKIMAQSMPFFGKNSVGSLMGKATNDIDMIAEFSAYGVMTFFDGTIFPLVIIILMAAISPWLTLASILALPLLLWLTKYIGKKLYPQYDEAQEAFDAINDHVLENVTGVRVIRAFGMEEQHAEMLDELSLDMCKKNMKVAILSSLFNPSSKVVGTLCYVVALMGGFFAVNNGTMTLGDLVAFIFYLGMISWPMIAIGEFINNAEQGSASMDRIQEILDYPEDMHDPVTPEKLANIGDIEFKDFSFYWPQHQKPVLKNLTFRVKKGQTVGIVGKIGSGKTTLVKQLLRYYPQPYDTHCTMLYAETLSQHDREILSAEAPLKLDNKAIQLYRRADIRQNIGYVPQETILFSRSIRENILMGMKKNDMPDINAKSRLAAERHYRKMSYRDIKKQKEKLGVLKSTSAATDFSKNASDAATEKLLQEAIDAADFQKDLQFLPHGLDTIAGEKGISLSGGQKQRIAIARALISDPELLILDDSLSAVDGKTEENVLAALNLMRQGKTTLICAHRLSAVCNADLILVLDNGEIIDRGTHAELMQKDGWYKEQYELQQLEKHD